MSFFRKTKQLKEIQHSPLIKNCLKLMIKSKQSQESNYWQNYLDK